MERGEVAPSTDWQAAGAPPACCLRGVGYSNGTHSRFNRQSQLRVEMGEQ